MVAGAEERRVVVVCWYCAKALDSNMYKQTLARCEHGARRCSGSACRGVAVALDTDLRSGSQDIFTLTSSLLPLEFLILRPAALGVRLEPLEYLPAYSGTGTRRDLRRS